MSIFDDFGVSSGVKRGLAYRHDYSQSMNNMMNIKQYEDRKRQEREQKAMYVAQSLSKQNVDAPISQKRYDAFYKNNIYSEYKKLQEENPRWMEDPETVVKFNELSNKLINNSIVADDIEYKKNRQMAMEDTESSIEYKAEWLSKADAWANQEFDQTKDPNNYRSDIPLPKYFKETQYGWDDVVLKTKTNFLDKYDIETPEEKGNFLYTTKSMSETKIDSAYNMIISDSKDLNALNTAYNLYKNEDSFKEIPVSREEFGKSALRNTVTPIQQLHGYNLKYENKMKQDGIGSIGNMPTRFPGLLADLSTDGIADVSYNGLAFTIAKKKGNVIDLRNSGAVIPNVGTVDASPLKDLLGDATTITADKLNYVKENNSSYVRTLVSIPRPASENAKREIEQLVQAGFEEAEKMASGFAIETGTNPEYFNTRFVASKMWGWVYLPADLNNQNNIMDYEAGYSNDQKTRIAVSNNMPQSISMLGNTQQLLQSMEYPQDTLVTNALGYENRMRVTKPQGEVAPKKQEQNIDLTGWD